MGESDFHGTRDYSRRNICRPGEAEGVTHWAQPKTPTEICNFLGMVGYYRRFIKDFARLAGPLTQLTRKAVKFK